MLFQFGSRRSKSRSTTVLPSLERLEDRHLLAAVANNSEQAAEAVQIASSDSMIFDQAMLVQSVIASEQSAERARTAARSGEQDAVYYVSANGSDQNSGEDIAQAFQTIEAALRRVQPGDTVLVLPGVYQEDFFNPPGGTALHPVRLAAYDPDRRPILKPAPGADRVFTFASSKSSYIEVEGFVMDAVNVKYDTVKITWSTDMGGSHHISIRNSEIKNAPFNGILITGHEHQVSHNQLVNLVIHDNGTTDFDHGVYISTPHNLVAFSQIYRNGGWGIHNYGGNPSHNTYHKNRVFANGSAGARSVGIGIYNGVGVTVSENIVEDNRRGIVARYGASGAKFEGNVLRRNQFAFEIGPTVVDTVATANVLADNQDNTIRDSGINSILADNRIGLLEAPSIVRRGFLASAS